MLVLSYPTKQDRKDKRIIRSTLIKLNENFVLNNKHGLRY